ncbi:MAG: hypothetical protein ACE5FQ_06430 [Thiogranum sp.]
MGRRTIHSLSLMSFVLIAISSMVFGVVQWIRSGPVEGVLAYLTVQFIALLFLIPAFLIDGPERENDADKLPSPTLKS